jgi:hypothetical protein
MDNAKCDVIHFKIEEKYNLCTEFASWHNDTIRNLLIIVRAISMLLILNLLHLQSLCDRVHYKGLKDVLENFCILFYSNNMTFRPLISMNGKF